LNEDQERVASYSAVASGSLGEQSVDDLLQKGIDTDVYNLEKFPTLEPSLDDNKLDSILKDLEKAFNKKRQSDISKNKDLSPTIITSRKEVYLPDTDSKYDENLLVKSMKALALKLGYTVKEIPYGERSIRTLSERQFKIAAGIAFAPIDLERKFNINRKEDYYELGRTYARAQQCIGAFSSETKLGVEALKRNQRFFGNSPKETTGDTTKIPVIYMAKEIRYIFIESEWSRDLETILNILLRQSQTLLASDVRDDLIKDNVLPFSEVVNLFGEREIVVTPKQGRRPATKVKRVPKAPRQNSLFVSAEMKLISEHNSALFKAVEVLNKEDYIAFLKKHGFAPLKKRIQARASHRSEYLAKFAALTTKRLNEVRSNNTSLKSKRKRDITPEDVLSMLNRRNSPVSRFVDELFSLDPNCSSVNQGFAERDKSSGILDRKVVLQNITDWIEGRYPQLESGNQDLDEAETKLRKAGINTSSSGAYQKGKSAGSSFSATKAVEREAMNAVDHSDACRMVLKRLVARGLVEDLTKLDVENLIGSLDRVTTTNEFDNADGKDGNRLLNDTLIDQGFKFLRTKPMNFYKE